MDAIILCGGEAARWDNFMGVSKHLVPIDGVPLLHDTVAKLRQAGLIKLVIAGRGDDYKLPDAEYLHVSVDNCAALAEKFNSSRALWSKHDVTALLFGDVFFSKAAIATLCQARPDVIGFLGRLTGSRITGCSSPEIFAVTFGPTAHQVLDAALARIANAPVTRPTGWQLYGFLADLAAVGNLGAGLTLTFTHIDDMTEDFDFPVDYTRWIAQRVKAGGVQPDGTAASVWAANRMLRRKWQVRAQLALLLGFGCGAVTATGWLLWL